MKKILPSRLGRSLSGLAVGLVLFPLSLPLAAFAALNVAIALSVAGFGPLVTFVEGPASKGEGVELFGMSPGRYLTLQALALIAAGLLMLCPLLIGLAIAAGWRRLWLAASLTALALQTLGMLILGSSPHLTFSGSGLPSSPGAWGSIGILIYFGLACWGCLGKLSSGATPEPSLRINLEPPAGGSE